MDVNARLEVVERENEELREQVRQLLALLRGTAPMPIQFGLTGKEAALLGALMQGTVVSKESCINFIYQGRDEPELKIIDVFVCKVRKKLKPFGISVETAWGRGYMLSPEAKARVRAMQAAMGVAPEEPVAA